MKICIVIPVYNESRAIGRIVEQVRSRGWDAVVIDDGSADQSGVIAREKGATVITHPSKQGKGISLRDGFAYAVARGFDGVVAMDGDGQHAIEDVNTFLAKAQECPDSVISGNRMANCRSMPWLRFLVNHMMSWSISLICRQPIPDSQCGFRYIGTKVLKTITLQSDEFEIETEVLVQASRHGFKIYAVPIQTIYRDELSKINPFRDTIRFFRYVAKELLTPRPPR